MPRSRTEALRSLRLSLLLAEHPVLHWSSATTAIASPPVSMASMAAGSRAPVAVSLSTPTSTVYTSTATTITQVITALVCSSLSPSPHSLSFRRILRCDFHVKTTMSLGTRSASISAAYEHEFELPPQRMLDDCSAIPLEKHGQPQVCN